MKTSTSVGVRLELDLVERYRTLATATGRPMTRLMRDVLARRRLRLPPVVPDANREAMAELGALSADLHRVARTLDAGRSAAADASSQDAAVSVARALDALRHRRGDAVALEAALGDAEHDLRTVNSALHRVMDARSEEVDAARLDETLQVVRAVQAALHRVQLGLLGHGPGGAP